MSDLSLAQRLYPNLAADTPAAPGRATTNTPPDDLAARLYPELAGAAESAQRSTPPPPAAESQQMSTADRLYPEQRPEPQEAEPQAEPEGGEAFALEVPEGHAMYPETVDTFATTVQELGVTQETAQAVMDRMLPAMAERQQVARAEMQQQWQNEVAQDEALADALPDARRVIQQHGSPELLDLLNETGLGDNPAMVRFAARIARALSDEDGGEW